MAKKGRPKGSKNQVKKSISPEEQPKKQTTKTQAKTPTEKINNTTPEPTENEIKNTEEIEYLYMGDNYRIYRHDDKNLVIEELKRVPLYLKSEDGKRGVGKKVEGEYQDKWCFVGYSPNLAKAFKNLLNQVGLHSRVSIKRYMEELEEIREFIENNTNKINKKL